MVVATKPPKLDYPKLQIVPYVYALGLAVFAGAQLLQGSSSPYWLISIVSIEIFALPFLLQAKLSWLARVCSALFGLAAPYLILVDVMARHGFESLTLEEAMLFGSLVLVAMTSFFILNGQAALRVPKR
jgi:hypothetical protein